MADFERKPCTHLAGEFFVAAELSRRGFNVALTMGNAKRVDLIIEDQGRTIPIQVKAIAKRQNVGWPMPTDISKIIGGVIYVLVVLGAVDVRPQYFILSGSDVRRLTKVYKTRAILDISRVKPFENNWSLIEKAFPRHPDGKSSSLQRAR